MDKAQLIARPRKAMRKGTRSCYECRKRKVRCIFAKDASICDNCATRDKPCIEQRRELLQAAQVDSRESLKDRVTRLEAIIREKDMNSSGSAVVDVQSSGAFETRSRNARDRIRTRSLSASSVVSNPTPLSIESHDPSPPVEKESSQNIDPIITLFNNAIWKRHSSDVAQDHVSEIAEKGSPAAIAKRLRTCDALLQDLLAPDCLVIVMSATCLWWHTWRPLGPWLPASIGDKRTATLPDFVLWALVSPMPSVIGLAILCIAVCLQQLDTRIHQYIIRQLPRPPGTLFQEYLEKVNRFVICDSDYASTEEGIQTIMLSAKIHMNLGLNRKCWLLLHQAIVYSQLLGFHRPEHLSPRESDEERNRRNRSWLSLCAADIYASLLLGLPYAGDGRTIPISQTQDPTSLLQHNLILVGAEVIDRNQRGLSLSVSRTEECQKQLKAATQSLSAEFWDAPASVASGKISRDQYLEQITAQSWYQQILVLIHMPLMIHSVQDTRLEKHRVACLEACRSWLKIYHIMRSDPFSAFSMIKLIDYQAFVCAALLILGLLGYGKSMKGATNRDNDQDIITLTISALRNASNTVNNPVASQAVQGLETLMSLDGRGCPNHHGASCVNPHIKIVVPNAGTIIISPGEHIMKANTTSSTSLETQPELDFTLSQEMLASCADTNNGSIQQSNLGLNESNASSHEVLNSTSEEMAYIDFDWANTLAPNFEGDWAWLNDLTY